MNKNFNCKSLQENIFIHTIISYENIFLFLIRQFKDLFLNVERGRCLRCKNKGYYQFTNQFCGEHNINYY